jgi:small subunit ribosomal protein S17
MGGLKTGRVVSNAMQKTVVVEVERLVAHPLYRRTLRRTGRFLAHDERQECKPGDIVTIRECRPLSRRKRWRVHAVVRRAAQAPKELAELEKRVTGGNNQP